MALRRTALSLFVPGLLSGHLMAEVDQAPLAPPPGAYQIMTNEEAKAHKEKMAELKGQAKEDYRNQEYDKLKTRALSDGYLLPEKPPWGASPTVPAKPPASPMPPDQLTQQIEAQRKSLQAEIEAKREAMSSRQAEKPEAKAEEKTPNDEYRKAMKDRFDRYMEERQARIDAMDKATETHRQQAEAEHEARKSDIEAKRKESEARREAIKSSMDARHKQVRKEIPAPQFIARPSQPEPVQMPAKTEASKPAQKAGTPKKELAATKPPVQGQAKAAPEQAKQAEAPKVEEKTSKPETQATSQAPATRRYVPGYAPAYPAYGTPYLPPAPYGYGPWGYRRY